MLDSEGNEGVIQWFNMLNGMPAVGRAFSADLSAVLSEFDDGRRQEKMRVLLTDGECFHWSDDSGRYINVAKIVDDMLVVYKGPDALLEAFDAWQERRRWSLNQEASG